jgi:hypothetical protein
MEPFRQKKPIGELIMLLTQLFLVYMGINVITMENVVKGVKGSYVFNVRKVTVGLIERHVQNVIIICIPLLISLQHISSLPS